LRTNDRLIERSVADGQTVYTVPGRSGVIGFIVVDSTVGGRARGGLRMLADVGEEELRAAARTMTLKYGFVGVPQGGAKAGVRGDGEGPVEARRERLLEFARAALPLLRARVYVPDPDLGTRAADIRWTMQAAGLRVGPHEWLGDRSGFYTAVSCLAAAAAVREHRATTLQGCRVAIEGFGSVGSALADLLNRRGARVVAISTSRGAVHDPRGLDVARLLGLAVEVGSRVVEQVPGAERLPREALLELPVDLLCPCARHHSIHEGNAERVAAPVICPGANDPVSPGAARALAARGVLLVPDFVANCGGVVGGTLTFAGLPADRIRAIVERRLRSAVESLLGQSERQGLPLRTLAEGLALARHERVRRAVQAPGMSGRFFALGLEAYRRGWMPRALVAALAPQYVERRLLQ
jgi:glutamate dehydrogenase (NAD(P)+)